MPTRAVDITLLLPPFLLILFRVGGLTLTAPIFSSTGVPARVKAGFAFVVSLMIAPIVLPRVPLNLPLGEVLVSVFGELLIGLILGMSVGFVFLGTRLAGMIIAQQAGIALGRVINPMMDDQTTIVGQVYFLVTLMVFLAIGGHRAMMAALLDTYRTIPPAGFRMSESFLPLLVTLLTSAFKLAMRMAAPAVITLFMASLTMGLLSRTIPQLNVLTVGFAVRVLAGLTMAALALPYAFDLINEAVVDTIVMFRDVVVTTGAG